MTSLSEGKDQRQLTPLTRLEWLGIALALLVALVGAVLSWRGMYEAALNFWKIKFFAGAVPVAVDGFIMAGAVMWVASVRAGRRGTAWRAAAHFFIGLTIFLNAYGVLPDMKAVAWHIAGPLSWSALVELIAHHITEKRRNELDADPDRIPLRLWLVSPRRSFRTWVRMARTGERNLDAAWIQVDRTAGAIDALKMALPHRRDRRLRRMIVQRLRGGSLPTAEVLRAVGWGGGERPADVDSQEVVRRALEAVLADGLTDPTAVERTERAAVQTGGRSDGRAVDSMDETAQTHPVASPLASWQETVGQSDGTTRLNGQTVDHANGRAVGRTGGQLDGRVNGRPAGETNERTDRTTRLNGQTVLGRADEQRAGRSDGRAGGRPSRDPAADLAELEQMLADGRLAVPLTEQAVKDALGTLGSKYARRYRDELNARHGYDSKGRKLTESSHS